MPLDARLVLTPNWFKDTFIGVEVEQWIGIGVLFAIFVASYLMLRLVLSFYVRHVVSAENRDFWRQEQRRLNRPLLLLALAGTLLVGFPVLDFDADIEDVVNIGARVLGSVAIVLLLFRAIDIFTDTLRQRAELTTTKFDDQLIPIVRTLLKIFTIIVGGLFILANLDVNIASLIAGVGIGGLAIALAAQDTIKNLLGGLTVFTDKPFEVGDWVVIGDSEGTVEEVGFRSTKVRTFYNSRVTIPNMHMTDGVVDNMGARAWRRYKTTLGLAYHTPPEKVQAFVEGVRATIRANPSMRTDYYMVEFHGFGPSTLDVLLYCFIRAGDWNEELRVRHILNLDILRLAESLQVEFAFPTQTLHVVETPDAKPDYPPLLSDADLARTIEDFGPDGAAGQRVDRPLTSGYDNG